MSLEWCGWPWAHHYGYGKGYPRARGIQGYSSRYSRDKAMGILGLALGTSQDSTKYPGIQVFGDPCCIAIHPRWRHLGIVPSRLPEKIEVVVLWSTSPPPLPFHTYQPLPFVDGPLLIFQISGYGLCMLSVTVLPNKTDNKQVEEERELNKPYPGHTRAIPGPPNV